MRMEPSMDKLSLYHRFMSFLTQRFLAALFMAIGGFIGLVDSYYLLPGKTINENGTLTSDMLSRLMSVVLPLFVACIGWLMWRYKPMDRFHAWMERNLSDDPPRDT